MKNIDKKLLRFTLLFMAISFALALNILTDSFLAEADERIMQWIGSIRNIQMINIFLFFTNLGSTQTTFILGILALSTLALFGRWRMMQLFFLANVVGGISYRVLKILIQRARPDENFSLVFNSGYSFPSGHATASMIFYGMLGYFLLYLCQKKWQRIMIASLLFAIIFMIGASRIYLGVHWVTDVLAGWLFGIMTIFGTLFIYRRWEEWFCRRYG
jgi:undecaprenyl-diphosphatase